MQLVIRIITVKDFPGDTEILIKDYLNKVKLTEQPQIVKSDKYYKIQGHKEILFKINEDVAFNTIVDKSGKSPVFLSETEAIFDSNQGSKISLNDIYWIHLEVMSTQAQKNIGTCRK